MRDWNQAKNGTIGAHTDGGRQCADAIEAGIGADGPVHILHMGMRSGGLRRDGAAYIMPDWAKINLLCTAKSNVTNENG